MTAVLFLSFASGLPFNLTNFSFRPGWRLRDRRSRRSDLCRSSRCPTTSNSCGPRSLTATCRRFSTVAEAGCWSSRSASRSASAHGFLFAHARALRAGGVAVQRGLSLGVPGHRHRCVSRGHHSGRASVASPPRRPSFGYRTAAMLAGTVLVLIAGAPRLARSPFCWWPCLMAVTLFVTFWAPPPETPGHPPRTLIDAVWHPLRDCSKAREWGILVAGAALQGRRRVCVKPLQHIHAARGWGFRWMSSASPAR